MNAASRRPEIKAAYDAGLEDCKRYIEKLAAWQPTVSDIQQVESLAAQGYGPVELAGALKVSRATFMRRLEDTPQLRQALEVGQGRYRTELIELSEQMLRDHDPDLRFIGPLLTFKLKAYCQLGESKPVLVEAKIEHTHRLKAPPPVAIEHIAEFAKSEMLRAKKLAIESGIVSESPC
jgi:hypothetical protein